MRQYIQQPLTSLKVFTSVLLQRKSLWATVQNNIKPHVSDPRCLSICNINKLPKSLLLHVGLMLFMFDCGMSTIELYKWHCKKTNYMLVWALNYLKNLLYYNHRNSRGFYAGIQRPPFKGKYASNCLYKNALPLIKYKRIKIRQ